MTRHQNEKRRWPTKKQAIKDMEEFFSKQAFITDSTGLSMGGRKEYDRLYYAIHRRDILEKKKIKRKLAREKDPSKREKYARECFKITRKMIETTKKLNIQF